MDFSVFFGDHANADELGRLISIVESIDCSTVPIANNCRSKRWRQLFLQSPGRVKTVEDFVKFDSHTCEVYVTKVCLAQITKLLTRRSSSRPDLACQSQIVTEGETNIFVETHCVIRLPATEFAIQLLLPWKPVSIVVDTLPEVGVEEPDVEEPSEIKALSSSTTHPAESVSQLSSNTDRLWIIRGFVGCMAVDGQFAVTEDEIEVYLRAKLVNARWE